MKRLFNFIKKKTYDKQKAKRKWLQGFHAFKEGLKHTYEGRDQEAVDCFDKAIKSGVEFEEVYAWRGMCLWALDFHLDAIDDFNKAISLEPADCELYYMRSLSKSATGDFEGCVTDLQEAIRLSEVDNENNRTWNSHAKEMGWRDATFYYKTALYRAKLNIKLPEDLKKRYKKKYSARRGVTI